MNIQPIPYGPQKEAVQAELLFGEIGFDSDVYCFKVRLMDELNNILDILEKQMSKEDYESLGQTKEERGLAILTELGITAI